MTKIDTVNISAMQCRTVQHSALECKILHDVAHTAVQYSIVQCSVIKYCAVHFSAHSNCTAGGRC